MRKCFIGLLIMYLLSIMNASSEILPTDFSIRNGVTFGLTRDEVKSIELKNGYHEKYEETDRFYITDLDVFSITCSIEYIFENDVLTRIVYLAKPKENDIDIAFIGWEYALSSKYGKPMWSSNNNSQCPISIAGGEISEDSDRIFAGSTWSLEKSSEWLVPTTTGFLKIEQTIGTQKVTLPQMGTFNYRSVAISYGLLSKEDGEAVWSQYLFAEQNATPVPTSTPTPVPVDINDSI